MLATGQKMQSLHCLSFYLDSGYSDKQITNLTEQNAALELASGVNF